MLKDIDEGVYIDKAILTTLDKDTKPKAPNEV